MERPCHDRVQNDSGSAWASPPATGPTMKRLISRRVLLILFGLGGVYALTGFLIVPPVARARLVKSASAALGRPVAIERTHFNPFTFSFAVDGLRVTDHDGGELASWRRASVNFDPLASLFRWRWQFSEVRLTDPKQRLLVDRAGQLNIADLFAPAAAPAPAAQPPPSGALPRLAIGLLQVEGWTVDFTDQSRHSPFHRTVGPMAFSLTGFTTRPNDDSPYTFAGTTDAGERFAWAGSIGIQPFGSKGHLEIANLSLPALMPLLEEYFGGELRSGRLGFATDYEIVAAGEPAVRLANTVVTLEELAIARPGVAAPAVALARLRIEAPRTDLLARMSEVAKVALDGLAVHAIRARDGTIDLTSFLAAGAAGPSAATPPAAANPAAGAVPAGGGGSGPSPAVHVAELTIADSAVTLLDLSSAQPAQFVADRIALAAHDLGTDPGREIALEASLRWAGRGSVSVRGTVRPQPLAAALDVEGDALDLLPFNPLLGSRADVSLTGADLRLAGHVEVTQPVGQALHLAWAGDLGLEGFGARTARTGTGLVAWKTLSLGGTKFSLEPLQVSVAEVALVEPVADVVIDRERRLNFAALAAPAGATATTAAAAKPAAPADAAAAPVPRAPPPDVSIGAIVVSGGRVRVRDESIEPAFSSELRDIAGSIRGLSSDPDARAGVDFTGALDGTAPLRIAGTINPLAADVFADVRLSFGDIALPPFTPYSGRYLGQTIRQGTLRVDLAYQVSQRVLDGQNRIVLDQFFLGEHVESPDAIKLPVGLALAVLRDREGRILLDPGVHGNLDDPGFRYGQIVWRTLGNVIVKAATSPFSLLGGLVGGGHAGEDLARVEFASGSAGLSPGAISKLDVLAKALYERPALQLAIHAPPAPAADEAGLRERRLAGWLAEEQAREPGTAPADANAHAPAAEASPAPAADELIRRLFARQFPDEVPSEAAPSVAPGTPAAAADEPSALSRWWRRTFGGGPPQQPADAPPAETRGGEAAAAGGPTVGTMRARLLAAIELAPADFEALALERARTVRDRLVASGKVEPARVSIAEEEKPPAETPPAGGNPHVSFELK